MPLMLDDMRAEFARFLTEDPAARFRMDAALAHVITTAYERGLDDGKAVRFDLVSRAEMDTDDGAAVLNISNGVLMQMDTAIAKVKP